MLVMLMLLVLLVLLVLLMLMLMLMLLPCEGHGYRAAESVSTVLAEQYDWLERYCVTKTEAATLAAQRRTMAAAARRVRQAGVIGAGLTTLAVGASIVLARGK